MKDFWFNWRAQWRHLLRSPSDLGLLVIFPLVVMALIAAMLVGGVLRHVPVAVIDEDQSEFSRALVHNLTVSPTLALRHRSVQPDDVMPLLRGERIYAALHIPRGVGEGLARHTRPVITIYYNAAFLTSGKMAEGAIESAVTATLTEALPRELNVVRPVPGRHIPVVQSTVLYNAATSFEWYLQALIHPAVLHLLIACASVMAMGRLLHGGSLAAWSMRQRSVALALAGRLAPGVLIVSAWGAVWLIWLCGVRGWRPEGSLALIWLGQLGLYAATAAVSAMLVAVTRDVGVCLSASAVYAGSALAYSGGTLPLVGASWYARHWSAVLPFPHYLKLQMDQFLGAPTLIGLRSLGVLVIYAMVAGGIACLAVHGQRRRLRQSSAPQDKTAEPAMRPSTPWTSGQPSRPAPSVLDGCRETLLEVLHNRQLTMIVVVGVLFYAFYYPAPYAHQTAQQLPVVVADEDRTPASRAFITDLGATREVAVVATVGSFAEARQLVLGRSADGIVLLPSGLASSILAGDEGAGIGVWVNGAYLTRASSIGTAVRNVVLDGLRARLAPLRAAMHIQEPVDMVVRPLFNPNEGYASYVFPAVAMVILQQTLLFGAAMLAAQRRRQGRLPLAPAYLAGTLAALALLGTAATAFMFGWAFWIEDMPRRLQLGPLALAVPLFALTAAALGTALGSYFTNPNQAMAWLAPSSVPLFFLSGASWPLAQMPVAVAALAHLSPATLGIHVFVPLNQMGATLGDLAPRLAALTVLALGYVLWAAWRSLGAPTGSPRKP
ncbi:ABC transporter permease [Ottowia sp.]|uniref:ABC transporter permease n=1 Tax=Ottowia sp. TaxID=1898956 RepID=UPI0026052A63|nr:ABC transporter permease [Ottowia sp.]